MQHASYSYNIIENASDGAIIILFHYLLMFCGGTKMKNLYLDHNVYIEALENERLNASLRGLMDKKIQCLYSPAHIEEIYKVVANEKSQYKNKMKELINFISIVTSDMEVIPTNTEIVIKKEHPKVCYSRVSSIDTRERVKEDSCIKYTEDKNNYLKLLHEDKHNSSLSSIEPEKIWESPIIVKYILDFNNNIDFIIEKYNTSLEVQMLSIFNVDKTLPDNFCLRRGNFAELEISHKQLEYTIEILFRILNFAGYCSEKSEQTSISGTHDVSHAIYATKADFLVTMDRRFAKKCKAVYNFLGVRTSVIFCKQNEVVNVLENIVTESDVI